MYVDLTKPDMPEPDEPAAATAPLPEAATTGPEPTAVLVEKEPVRLTAREEFMLPLKAFGAAVVAGTPVLVGKIATAAWEGVRTASRTANTAQPKPAPKKPAAKADLRKDDEPAADSNEGEGEDVQEEKAAAKATATTGGLGDAAERFAMGFLVVGVACVGGGGVLTVLWAFLAPYAGWVALALIVGWCLAAAHVAPAPEDVEEQGEEDTPGNDHENVAGEQLQEEDGVAAWARKKAAIRRFAEEAVAAGATGHRKEKGRGATVDSLLTELQRKRPLPEWDRKRMIDTLESVDIPVRMQMKFRVPEEVNGETKMVAKNLPGVHVEELTKALGRTPSLPGHLVPDITPGATPILTAVPDPDESLIQALDELSPEAPSPTPAEGRPGAA